jgi:GNAT superfamily N-acetyltransferase
MPATDSKQTATWSLPKFNHIEITYTTRDRFVGDAAWRLDPDEQHAQRVTGEIAGIVYDDGPAGETRTPLGTLELATSNLAEAEDVLLEVLDAHSQEWTHYSDVASRVLLRREFLFSTQTLLIVDRVDLRPEARGHGLGLHVLARAIRTWGGDAITVLTAWPPGVRGSSGKAGGEALARYWSQLGFERLPGHDEPVLIGDGTRQAFWDTITAACEWESPRPVQA